tara:strand:- start:275 stop:931 length:657 start_codon:yes stop_codon:yes gene_type:complete
MLRLLVYAIIGISLLYILTEIIKFLSAISGTRNQMLKDKRAFLSAFDKSDIVKWSWKDLNTLSMELDYGTSKYDLITSAQEATFHSIYNEKLGHMMSKKYGDRELMLIVTEENTFELFKGHNHEVTFTMDQEDPITIKFSVDDLSIDYKKSQIKLNKTRQRGEVYINDESIVITNDSNDQNEITRRLVPVKPENVNAIYVPLVKFLLLFYLIWRQDSN